MNVTLLLAGKLLIYGAVTRKSVQKFLYF